MGGKRGEEGFGDGGQTGGGGTEGGGGRKGGNEEATSFVV